MLAVSKAPLYCLWMNSYHGNKDSPQSRAWEHNKLPVLYCSIFGSILLLFTGIIHNHPLPRPASSSFFFFTCARSPAARNPTSPFPYARSADASPSPASRQLLAGDFSSHMTFLLQLLDLSNLVWQSSLHRCGRTTLRLLLVAGFGFASNIRRFAPSSITAPVSQSVVFTNSTAR